MKKIKTLTYILVNGKPVPEPDLEKWGKWMEGTHNRLIVKDYYGKIEISTVFLGVDHLFLNSGTPLLYETMIFGGKLDGDCRRYTTKKLAMSGHRRMVKRVWEADKC